MENIERSILVPYDFTALSDNAIQHGIQFAKILNIDLVLLHIIRNLKDEIEASEKLTRVAEETHKKFNFRPKIMVRPGMLSTAINQIANNLNSVLVIMKTSGPKGIQKYTGSRAIKVMYGSKIPFIVVQGPPVGTTIKKVIFPIDFRYENKEKLKWINFLASIYKPSVYLFRPNTSDYRIRNNLKFATRFLEGRNIEFELVHSRGKKAYVDEALEFSNFLQADLIIIMLSRSITTLNILLGLKDQKYISNEYKIPVMCLNARTDLRKFGGFR